MGHARREAAQKQLPSPFLFFAAFLRAFAYSVVRNLYGQALQYHCPAVFCMMLVPRAEH